MWKTNTDREGQQQYKVSIWIKNYYCLNLLFHLLPSPQRGFGLLFFICVSEVQETHIFPQCPAMPMITLPHLTFQNMTETHQQFLLHGPGSLLGWAFLSPPQSLTHSLSASWSWGWQSPLPSAAGEWPHSVVCPWGSRCWWPRSGPQCGWLQFWREKALSESPEIQFLWNTGHWAVTWSN